VPAPARLNSAGTLVIARPRLILALLIGLLTLGVGATPVFGHAQLLSSVPGAGEVLLEPPPEIRLAFSEPVDARFVRVNILDADGNEIASAAGVRDEADSRLVVADLGAMRLPNGAYDVTWRMLSAADGHATAGVFTFGVGEGAPVGAGSGSLDTGSHGHPTTEVEVRLIGSLGPLLASGLALFAVLVLRPVTRRWPRRLAMIQIVGLGVGAVGAVLTAVVAGGAAGIDPVVYLRETRTGGLLGARALAGVAGAIVAAVLVRRGLVGPAVLSAGGVGVLSLVLIALAGHAAAYASPVPAAVMVVHLLAASVWFGGVMALGDLAVFGPRPRRGALAALVPRFSALALAAVALIGLTGAYSAWLETGDPIGDAGVYAFALRLKVIAFAAALSLGAFNYLDGGRRRASVGGFERRIAFEAAFAIGVVVLAGNLAAASPPGLGRPVEIAQAATSATARLDGSLAIQPGRPGPNRFTVSLDASPPAGSIVELRLHRTDDMLGASTVALRPVSEGHSGARAFVADAGILPAESGWNAEVVVVDEAGIEQARARFAFVLDDATIASGRAMPPIAPSLAAAGAMLIAALITLAFVLAGGAIPRVEPRLGRAAALAASVSAAALGLVVLVAGPPF
jgi:methionine-rich copper-binding protein CopC/putative copper export protein